MIYSQSRQFLFLKPFKVGGTSVLQALGTKCRDGDLVSALFLEPEDLSRFPTSQLTPLPQHVYSDRPRATRYKINTSLNTHALPRMIQDKIGRKAWDRAFKVSIVRSPWDLMVSFRGMRLLNPNGFLEPAKTNFSSFVERFDFTTIPPPYNEVPINDCWYFDPASDRPLVDFFLRFERLQADFDTLCDRLQLPRQRLPHMQRKTPRPHYCHFYDPATRDRVAQLFARTIDSFGYTFEACGISAN